MSPLKSCILPFNNFNIIVNGIFLQQVSKTDSIPDKNMKQNNHIALNYNARN